MILFKWLIACSFITFVKSYQHMFLHASPVHDLELEPTFNHRGPYRRIFPVSKEVAGLHHSNEYGYGPIPYDNSDIRGFPLGWVNGFRRFAVHQLEPTYNHRGPYRRIFPKSKEVAGLQHPNGYRYGPIPYDHPDIRGFPVGWVDGFRRFAVRHPSAYRPPPELDYHTAPRFPIQSPATFDIHPSAELNVRPYGGRDYKPWYPVWGDGDILHSFDSHDGSISYNDGEPMPEVTQMLFGGNTKTEMNGGNSMTYWISPMEHRKPTTRP